MAGKLLRVAKIQGYVDVERDPVAYVKIDHRDYLLRAELINALDVPASWVEPRTLTVFVKLNSWEKRQLVPRDHLDDIIEHVEEMRRLSDLRAGIDDDDSDNFIVDDDEDIDVRDDESSEREREGYEDESDASDSSSVSNSRPGALSLTAEPDIEISDDPVISTTPRVITDDEDSVPTDDIPLQAAKKRRVLMTEDS